MSRWVRLAALSSTLIVIALLLSFGATPVATAQSTVAYTGEYFNNMTLSGSPVVVRDDPQINFDWGLGQPDVHVPADYFSVRWQRWYYVSSAGNYTLTMTTDDGSRLYVDNTLVIDMWYDHAPLARATTRNLSKGYHLLRMEYYEKTGGALAQLEITSAASYPDWKGEYFNNETLSGSPTLTVNNTAINFNWGSGSPDPAIPVDHFSVRWTRNQYFNAGTYRFTATTDDGMRVWVGSTLLLDAWYDQGPTTYNRDITLSAGTYPLRVEYYENAGGAIAQLAWAVAPAAGSWTGYYYNNPYLGGSPTFTRNDADVNFTWGYNSPGSGIAADNFSAKWDSVRYASGGYYTVSVSADDGVRVWVDGVPQIDAWFDQGANTTYRSSFYLSPGNHNWHVEYYEHAGYAEIHLQIVAGAVSGSEIIVDDNDGGWVQGGCASCWRTAGGYAGDSHWTWNNYYAAPDYNWARWYPSLPAARNYEVFVYIPGGIASTHNARYWIAHAGVYDLVPLAQANYSNQWVSLGTYYFSAAGGENVSLSDVTYECYVCYTLVFDAVKFVPR